jgi:hypothetical protein
MVDLLDRLKKPYPETIRGAGEVCGASVPELLADAAVCWAL